MTTDDFILMFPEDDNQVDVQDNDFQIAIIHVFKEFKGDMNKNTEWRLWKQRVEQNS